MPAVRAILVVALCALAAPECPSGAGASAPVSVASCGDGVADGDEACDLGAGNGDATTCCTADCRLRAAGETCRPSAGLCDSPEECSGLAGECPGDSKVVSGAVCRDAVGVCDVAERCDGVADDCPADMPAPDGTPCDDANACTATDACASGACVGTGGPACDPCEVCDATRGCLLPAAAGCRTAPSRDSSITIKRVVPDPTRDLVTWRWLATEPAALADFGDPMRSSDYTLCVLDATSGAPTLRMRLTARAGGECRGQACWKGRGQGMSYKNKDATPDGMLSMGFRSGAPVKLKAKGKGANLVMPFPALVPPVVVRMVRSDGPQCWEARYSRPIADLATLFKARSD